MRGKFTKKRRRVSKKDREEGKREVLKAQEANEHVGI